MPAPQPDGAVPEQGPAPCWRCGKTPIELSEKCAVCGALLMSVAAPADIRQPSDDATPLMRMLALCAIMVGVSLVWGIAQGPARIFATDYQQPTAQELLTRIITLEAIDTFLVLFALIWIGMPRRKTSRSLSQTAIAWIIFWPVLGGLLVINVGYHFLLTEGLGLPLVESELVRHKDWLYVWVLVICVQPAVVEELFFRGVALGILRSYTNVHAAVWISSLMFAMAHIGVPLSMPVLFVLGLGLGYARVASGGLLLPMAMHFVHNAVVIGVEWHQWHVALIWWD
jgi:membrane protease YdiL (CAAX protease family)